MSITDKILAGGLIPIFDFGHGYLINGVYQTKGKRSPDYPEGVLYEGVSNRHFGNAIMEYLATYGVPFFMVNGEPRDVGLGTRANRANKIYAENPNTYLFSIHSNGGGGTGIEGFTSRGDTDADPIAEVFLSAIEKAFPDLKMRFDASYDGDKDKEANYQILRETKCPSFLLEILFMDFYEDYKKLKDPEFRKCMVECIGQVMVNMYYGQQ